MALGLQRIIDDLFIAATEKILDVDPDGGSIRIFVDMVAMMCDNPQAAKFSDVIEHSTNTLCLLCCMRKHKNHTFRKTNYSSENHSGRLCLIRFDPRR